MQTRTHLETAATSVVSDIIWFRVMYNKLGAARGSCLWEFEIEDHFQQKTMWRLQVNLRNQMHDNDVIPHDFIPRTKTANDVVSFDYHCSVPDPKIACIKGWIRSVNLQGSSSIHAGSHRKRTGLFEDETCLSEAHWLLPNLGGLKKCQSLRQ